MAGDLVSDEDDNNDDYDDDDSDDDGDDNVHNDDGTDEFLQVREFVGTLVHYL